MKSGLLNEGDSLVAFYYNTASEIWPEKRGGYWWERPYKRGIIVFGKIKEEHGQHFFFFFINLKTKTNKHARFI